MVPLDTMKGVGGAVLLRVVGSRWVLWLQKATWFEDDTLICLRLVDLS